MLLSQRGRNWLRSRSPNLLKMIGLSLWWSLSRLPNPSRLRNSPRISLCLIPNPWISSLSMLTLLADLLTPVTGDALIQLPVRAPYLLSSAIMITSQKVADSLEAQRCNQEHLAIRYALLSCLPSEAFF